MALFFFLLLEINIAINEKKHNSSEHYIFKEEIKMAMTMVMVMMVTIMVAVIGAGLIVLHHLLGRKDKQVMMEQEVTEAAG